MRFLLGLIRITVVISDLPSGRAPDVHSVAGLYVVPPLSHYQYMKSRLVSGSEESLSEPNR